MKYVLVMMLLLGLCGCQTAKPSPKDSQAQTISALQTMTEGLTNQPITQAQMQNLGAQMANDPQARSAVQSINSALSPEQAVKYCPEDGERFSADMIWCPDHKVKLEWVE